MSRPRFHLAFPVRDLEEARRFYGGLLGCPHALHHRAADPFRGPAGRAGDLFLDPSRNALELKAFADEAMLFAK